MKELMIPQPNGKQLEFLRATAAYVGFGGARGGGKSWVVRYKAVLLCLQYPGIQVMIVRKTYPELSENHILPLCRILNCFATKKSDKLAVYKDSKKYILFPNGSRILFRYLDNEKDAERFQGTEVDVLFVDEATQQSRSKIEKLTACVRGANDFPKRCYYTFNPGGEGHDWAKRLFIDRRFEGAEKPEDYVFIQSLLTDNRALMEQDPGYLRRLEALPPKLRRAWLEGDWNVFDGQFFEEFRDDPAHYSDRRFTHVIEPFAVPSHWSVCRSFDWGYNKPFSCGWWAVDPDGTVYRILELYGCSGSADEGVRWTPDRVFGEIHRIETEHPLLRGRHITGVADPAIWDAQYGESIADVAAKHQVWFRPGDHQRIPGWLQLHYRLQFDENGYPGLYVFRNCRALIRTLPTLRYDPHRPEDLDSSGEDHAADETRYFLMSRPIRPKEPRAPGRETENARLFLDIDSLQPCSPGEKLEIMEEET
ncbi:MAG: phage terminase large subunit [Oscillospiraceae bacterium]|nr:phage terminase large subunit [Oscillospiraceae bacterium]